MSKEAYQKAIAANQAYQEILKNQLDKVNEALERNRGLQVCCFIF